MSDLRITELTALTAADLDSLDVVPAVDVSGSVTRKLTVKDLVEKGVTLIADDTVPGKKLLFNADGTDVIPTAGIADDAITTAKIADDAITADQLANESTVDLVTEKPLSGAFTGQFALDTDDNKLYCWDGTAWQDVAAPGSINTVEGDTAGIVDIVVTKTADTVTVSASINNTGAANQFLAGPTSGAGAAAYRTIDGSDLPVATTSAKGGVVVNGEGLRMDSNTIEVDNDVTASTTHHVVTYDAKGLITGGRTLTSTDLPIATASAVGGVIPGSGLSVDASGNLDHSNTATPGTFTKVTVDAQGHVTTGDTLDATDIPDLPATKLTSGTIGSALIASDAITATKLADDSVTKFGGAGATDNVVTFPDADFKGQFFFDELNEDLYIHTGSAYLPITVISGNLILAGTYDASTNTLDSVTSEGSAAGFTNGQALPAPASTNQNYYVVVSVSGTGSGAAPSVALAPPDMLLSTGAGADFTLIDVSNAIAGQTASNIAFTASGNIAATDVQAAIQELDTEKAGLASPSFTGNISIGAAGTIVYEGSTDDDYETTLTVADPTADRTITFPNISGTLITTGDTGTVTSAMILNGTIANADISATAEIAVSKLANGTARQLLQTDAAGTGVEFTSNVDIPGTLDVTGAVTFDSTLQVVGNISTDASLVFEGATADAFELTLSAADPTADVTVTIPASTTTLAGLGVAQSYTKAQRGTPVALTDAATIAVDLSLGNNFTVTLAGNRTLGAPTNVTAGQSGVIVVTQDGTGSRTLAYNTVYKFAGGTAPTLTTTASAVDVLAYYVESATRITVTSLLNVS
jgi:hypothetical protein